MDSKRTEWHGTDVSLEECMYEYGFVMRYVPENEEYKVLFNTGEGYWQLAWFDYDGWVADLMESEPDHFPDLHGLAKMCGMTPDEYLECVDESGLCSDLLAYYGWPDVLGEAYYRRNLTEDEVWKMVNE